MRARTSRRRRLRDSRSTTPRELPASSPKLRRPLGRVPGARDARQQGSPLRERRDCITHLPSAKSCLARTVAGSPSGGKKIFARLRFEIALSNDVRNLDSRSFLLYPPPPPRERAPLSQHRICTIFYDLSHRAGRNKILRIL